VEDSQLITHLIDIKQRLTHLDTKLDILNDYFIDHVKEDDEVHSEINGTISELTAIVNKGKGVLIAVSFATAVLGIFVALQRLGLL
jgi:hypothetical protein